MSTDVASIMLPVSRALMDRELDSPMAGGVHPNAGGAPAAVRGMKRGDPEPDGPAAAALLDSTGAECKRPRMDGSVGQVSPFFVLMRDLRSAEMETRLRATSLVQGTAGR